MSQVRAEQQRRTHEIIRLGVIKVVNYAQHQVRVQTGNILTDWLDWPADITAHAVRWKPLKVGTEVVLASPSGDLRQAKILGQLHTPQQPPPSHDPDREQIVFDDGTLIEYHSGNPSTLRVNCTGSVEITSAQQVSIQATTIQLIGQVHIQGPVTQTGGDITSEGHGLQAHHHISNIPGKPSSPAKP